MDYLKTVRTLEAAADTSRSPIPVSSEIEEPHVLGRINTSLGIAKKAKEAKKGPSSSQWLTAWRELATLTAGLTAEDPRLQTVLTALNVCDMAFEADDWTAFEKARKEVLRGRKGIQGH